MKRLSILIVLIGVLFALPAAAFADVYMDHTKEAMRDVLRQTIKFGFLETTDLVVETDLTTETISSPRHQRQGRRLDGDNRGLLVGSALVEPSGEAWLDRFLGLPDEALAVLECRLALP